MALPSSNYIGAGTPNLAVSGGVLVAPLNSTLPTTAAGVIDPAFKALGYVSEDGIESLGERKVETVKDWNADIIAQLQTEHSVRFGLTLYAVWDQDVLSEIFGENNVTATAATATSGKLINVKETGLVLPRRSWIFDMKTEDKKLRIVLPNAKISSITEKKFVSNELAGFTINVEAFKDDTGVKAYRYLDDGIKTA
ncbi:phage tail tube protein [Nocardia asteroides]|uniref:phage tail tube protein n=1 Tax=Nocardia asteroides TaxID=1824 RepID=UPI00365DDB44